MDCVITTILHRLGPLAMPRHHQNTPLPILLTRPNDPYPQPGSYVATHSRLGRAVLPSIYCNSLPRRVV